MAETPPDLALQVRLGRLLGLGFALSLVSTGGLGSLAALVIGIRALILIRRARGEVAGKILAWWCVVAGAFGAATLPSVVTQLIKAVKQ